MADATSTYEERPEPGFRTEAPRGRKRPPAGVLVLVGLLVVMVLGLVWFLFLRDDGGASSDDVLNRALAAHVDGDLGEAARLYTEVLAEDPSNKFAHYNLGQIAQTQGRFDQAEVSYRAALAIDPAYGPALFNLGILRFQAGDFNGAVDSYRQLIVADPNNAAAHLNLGFALRAAGSTEQGDQSIATAIELDPSLEAQAPAPTETTIAPVDEPAEGETTTTIDE